MNEADARPSGYSLALNAVPFGFVACAAALAWWVGIAAALAWVYLLPPVFCRLLIVLFGRPEGEALGQATRAYKVWWLIAQLQMPFNRFPALDEALRLAPGLYALWLNLWGSSVSPVVFWGPGALVLDRHALRVGRGVVIGTRAVLSAHLGVKEDGGAFRVTLAPVEIGAGALIGANAGIGPGCRVAAGAEVPAATFMRPFTRWEGAARVRADRPRAA